MAQYDVKVDLSVDGNISASGLSVAGITAPGLMKGGVSTGGNTAGTTGTVSNQLIFVGGNNVTLSQSTNATGATISIVGPSGAMLAGISTAGNTAGTTGLVSNRIVFVGGNSITLSQSTDTNGATLSVIGATTSQSIQTQNMVSVLGSTGDISFANGNGITFGGNASTITASHDGLTSQSLQTQNIIRDVNISGNTSGATADITSGTMTLAGGNNITLSQAGNAITISGPNTVAQTNQTLGLYGSGNTSGTSTGTVDARSLTFRAQGSLTVDMTNGIVNLSAPNALTTAMASNRGSDFVQAAAVFNGTNATGTIASNALSVSVAAQTNQTVGIYGSSNTSGTSSGTYDARSFSVLARGGVSVDMTNGVLNISGITSTPQTNQTVGIYGSSNTSGTSTGTADARSLSFLARGNISVDMTNGMVNLSVSTAAQTNQTLGLYMSSNTTSSVSSGTVDARSLTFRGAGNASVGYSAGEVVISVPLGGGAAGTNTFGMSNLGNTSGTTGVVTGTGVQFVWVGGNNVTLSQSIDAASVSGTITISGPNTVAQTNQTMGRYVVGNTVGQSSSSTLDARSMSLSAVGGVSAGMSAGNLIISGPAAMSMWPVSPQSTGMTNQLYSGSVGAGAASTNTTISVWAMPLALENPLNFGEIFFPVGDAATINNTSANFSLTAGFTLGIYTLSGSTLSLVRSYTNERRFTHNTTNTSGSASATWRMSWGGSATNGSSTLEVSTASATATGFWASITGSKMLPLRNGSGASTENLPAGQYVLLAAGSFSTAGAASLLNVSNSIGQFSGQSLTQLLPIGRSTNSSSAMWPFLGIGSTRMQSDAVWPLSYNSTNITTASNNTSFFHRSIPFVFMARN